MSNDYPEGIVWPDGEKVVGAICLPFVAEPEHVGNFLIVDYDEQIGGVDTLFVTINDRGSTTDPDDFTQYQRVEVSCWGKSRPVAKEGADRVLTALLNAGGEEVDGVLIDGVSDETGKEEVRLQNPDDRCVTRIIELAFRPIYPD